MTRRDASPALALGGGGARAAYQAGVLRALARRFPDISFPILTGVSAGAIHTAHLANHAGTFRESHWSPRATGQSCVSLHTFGVIQRKSGSSVEELASRASCV